MCGCWEDCVLCCAVVPEISDWIEIWSTVLCGAMRCFFDMARGYWSFFVLCVGMALLRRAGCGREAKVHAYPPPPLGGRGYERAYPLQAPLLRRSYSLRLSVSFSSSSFRCSGLAGFVSFCRRTYGAVFLFWYFPQ